MNVQPDLETGRRYLRQHPAPGRIIVCGVTGSHFYGFPAPDSDLDLKGIHVVSLRRHLGLEPSAQAHNVSGEEQGLLCDLTTNEAEQALRLLLKGNGNMLERIFTPFQIFETEELAELRALAPAYLSRRFYHHYHGFFKRVCEEHRKSGQGRIKSMLYSFRTALTGAYLLKAGAVEGDLKKLAVTFGFPEIPALIELYQEGSEKEQLEPDEDEIWQERWPELAEILEATLKSSVLPEEPADFGKCSDWLVNVRLREREP